MKDWKVQILEHGENERAVSGNREQRDGDANEINIYVMRTGMWGGGRPVRRNRGAPTSGRAQQQFLAFAQSRPIAASVQYIFFYKKKK